MNLYGVNWHEASASNFMENRKVNKNRKHSWQLRSCILAGCLTASLLPAVNAHAQQKPIKPAAKTQQLPPISDLIGKEILDIKFPDGWKYRGGVGFGAGYAEEYVQRGKQHGVLITWLTEKPVLNRPNKRNVLDALAVKVDPQDGFKFSDSCKSDGITEAISAEVRFKRCERYSTRVSRAWRLDSKEHKLVPISPKNIRCEFLFWDQGAEVPNCPSRIDISSKVIPSK
jgi:hypothetical protein